MSEKVIIIGCGGHGKVIADIIKKSGDTVFGFLDDDTSKEGVIGKICDCVKFSDSSFVIAIGNNSVREGIAKKYPHLRYYTAIHPTAVISDNVKIEKGTVVMANAVINAKAVIGEHCIINTASVVEHDCTVSDFVHISPRATLCGTVKIGRGCHIGAGAVIKNNISVCKNSVIGIGAAVVKDIEKEGTYVGVPAKILNK